MSTMTARSETFDPYHKWLGISELEQPPNHYRLLGIPPFESDPEVVQNASDQRTTHLKTFAMGQDSTLSQQLLGEVSAANACLSDPAKKRAYDEGLLRRRTPHPAHARASTVITQISILPAARKPEPMSPSWDQTTARNLGLTTYLPPLPSLVGDHGTVGLLGPEPTHSAVEPPRAVMESIAADYHNSLRFRRRRIARRTLSELARFAASACLIALMYLLLVAFGAGLMSL